MVLFPSFCVQASGYLAGAQRRRLSLIGVTLAQGYNGYWTL
jgi:hypothetical protein